MFFKLIPRRGTKTFVRLHSFILSFNNLFLNSFPEYHKGTSYGRQVGSLRSGGRKLTNFHFWIIAYHLFLNSFPEGGRKLAITLQFTIGLTIVKFLNSFPEYHKGTSYGRQVGSLRSGGRKQFWIFFTPEFYLSACF